MKKFYVLSKDGIAVQKTRASEDFASNLFEVEEITEEDFLTMPLPAKKVDGVWTKTDEFPEIDYPETEETEMEPSAEEDTAEMLVDHEYRITLLELGITE